MLLRADFRSLRHALPFALMIPQDETEAILTQRLAGLGHCVLRPAAAERIETAADGAVVTLVDGRRIATRYAVGADGQNSTVRDQAGIAFPGKTHGSFMLADVRMGWPIPKDEAARWWSRRCRRTAIASSRNAPKRRPPAGRGKLRMGGCATTGWATSPRATSRLPAKPAGSMSAGKGPR